MKKIIIPVRNRLSEKDLLLFCERSADGSNWEWTHYQLPRGLHTKVPDGLQATTYAGSDILSLAAAIRSLLQTKNNTVNAVSLNAYFPNEKRVQYNWADPLIPPEAYVIALLLVAGGVLMSFSLFGCVGGSAHALMGGAALLFVFAGGMLGMKGIGYFLEPFHTSRAVLFQSSPSESQNTTPIRKLHSE